MKKHTPWVLEDYLRADYEIRVRQKADGKFLFHIPELGLRHLGASLDEALPVLSRLKEEHLRRFDDDDLLDWVPRPGQMPSTSASDGMGSSWCMRALLPFAIKAVVVFAMFLAAANIIGTGVNNLGRGIEKSLDGIVKWSPEKVEANRARCEKIAQKLGPSMRELMTMFTHTPPPPALGAAPQADPATPVAVRPDAAAPQPKP